METKQLSHSYLETLSSADLLALADDYGIDVPDDLNRRFLIGELMEAVAESENNLTEDIGIVDDADMHFSAQLPDSYNETQIQVLLRSPVWAFVYWDIREATRMQLEEDFASLALRVEFFADEDAVQPNESFDIQVSLADRAQYVLLRPGRKFVRIELMSVVDGKTADSLAKSRKVALPEGSEYLTTLPGRDIEASPLQELSSLQELLRFQYENHRQAFFEE